MKKILEKFYKGNETTSYEELYDRYCIKIKYFDTSMPELKRIEKGDWIDLYTREKINLIAGQSCMIPLNVAMRLPDGYEALLVPRSGTYKKYGIIQTNGIGVIDNSYSGNNDEWMMPVRADRDTVINKGDRIAQFRIQKKMEKYFNLKTVDSLEGPDRGGFGSTGV